MAVRACTEKGMGLRAVLMVVVGCGGMQQLLEQYLHSAVSYHAKFVTLPLSPFISDSFLCLPACISLSLPPLHLIGTLCLLYCLVEDMTIPSASLPLVLK